VLPVWLPDTVTPDLGRAVHYTLLWGLEGVVLRRLGGGQVPDVNEAGLWRVAEAELAVVAVEPGLFESPVSARAAWMNDLARLHETLAFCGRVECRQVIVGALPEGPPEAASEALRQAAERAAARGVTLAVRNEGAGRETGAELSAVLNAAGSPTLTACWDPATALAAGEAPTEGLGRLAGRLGVVIVRDEARGHRKPLGEGAVGWVGLLTALAGIGFDGPLCLDLTGVRPKEGLREASALIALLRQARSGGGA
jgi:sugar phosphate isomerase/epimerase